MRPSMIILGLLFYIVSSSAQTWVRQNPFSRLSDINAIDFDGKFGLAVGNDSTLFTTADGGISWIPRIPTTSTTDITACLVVPGNLGRVLLAGGGLVLMQSDDWGETWSTVHNEIPNVYKIQVLTDGTFIALGSNFGLYSVDNGLLWSAFNMPAFGVTAGHFTSMSTGWVGQGPPGNMQIWYTSNGGFDWELRDPISLPWISSIEMINDAVGFMASKEHVYKTTNGGHTWNELNPVAAHDIHDMHVIDENRLWTSLDNGAIYFSTNGGFQWQERNPGLLNNNRALGLWANAQGEVWAVGKYVSILYSSNFGLTWTDQIPGMKQTLFEPHFHNAFTGMVGGSDGAIFKTTTSGGTWEVIQLSTDEDFRGMMMLGDSLVITGSTTGRVFRSDDLGDSWIMIGQNLGPITDLYAFNTQTIVVTNDHGRIYKTTDGGTQWNIVHESLLVPLYGLDFYDHQFGWANGISGKIYVTQNGGDTWMLQYNDNRTHFSDIHFTTPLEGWATSNSLTDTVWQTTDGGMNWKKLILPDTMYWESITFMDRDTGWIAGGDEETGVIFRTNNSGESWFLDHVSHDAFLGIYAIPNSETVWAVGYGGNIMKFSSCLSPPLLTLLRGNLEPCEGDTVEFVVEFQQVDIFDWTYPGDWRVLGNSNTATIHFIVGAMSGTVSVQGSDACGDSTLVLIEDVFPVIPPPVTIMENNGILSSDAGFGIYQWLLNGLPIDGATESTYEPTENGTYQLLFTTFTSGCEIYSDTLDFMISSLAFDRHDPLWVYPNPASNTIHVRYADGNSLPPEATIMLTHLDGRTILSENSGQDAIAIPDIPTGMYIIHIRTREGIFWRKIIVE